MNLMLEQKNRLRVALKNQFDKEEIRGFYLEMEIDLDGLYHADHDKLIADLLRHTINQQRIDELLNLAAELRPAIPWKSLEWETLENDIPLTQETPKTQPELRIAPTLVCAHQQDKDWQQQIAAKLPSAAALWDDQQLAVSNEFSQALQQAENIILLISSGFLSTSILANDLLARLQEAQHVQVLPVITKPCAWQWTAWLNTLDVLPSRHGALELLTTNELHDIFDRLNQRLIKEQH